MKKYFFAFCLVVASLAAQAAEAHQPRYIEDNQLVVINHPEISQAFYGELKGWPAFYMVDLKQAQDLYFQILVPDLPNIGKDKIINIKYMAELGEKAVKFAELAPAEEDWKKYYEEYAGDNYWQGPELKEPADPGYYLIEVSSPDNQGKYVLVAGQEEKFPAMETIKAMYAIPKLKKDFFQEPILYWFNGKIGRYIGLGLIGLIIFGFMFYRFNKVCK